MIKKKICMLGGYSVGKTSLVRQFVTSIFSEKYQATIGVKIDKKMVRIDDRDVQLMLWDIGGEEEGFSIPPSYLRGSAGYLLVVDGTRSASLDQAIRIQRRTREILGPSPFVVALNKADLTHAWALGREDILNFQNRGWTLIESSAKTGKGVEAAFTALTIKMLTAG